MFKRNDRVILKDEGIEATVVGYDTRFDGLVLLIPTVLKNPNYTWSSFADNLSIVNGDDVYESQIN